MVWSLPTVASRVPSGLNATEYTQSVWPVSGTPIDWPLDGSHSRTVPSQPAEASSAPSRLSATEYTKPAVSGSPVDGSHNPQGAVVAGGGQPAGTTNTNRPRGRRAGAMPERTMSAVAAELR
jgi:hypothetical protein